MRRISLFLLAAILVYLPAAAFSKTLSNAKKPTRGQYERLHSGKEVGENIKNALKKMTDDPAKKPFEWKVYRSPALQLTFRYPNAWRVSEDKDAVYAYPQANKEFPSSSRKSIFVIAVSKTTLKYSLAGIDAYFTQKSTFDPEDSAGPDWYIPAFTLFSSGSTTLFSQPARFYLYRGALRSEYYKAWNVIGLVNGFLYELHFRAPIEWYDYDKAAFEEFLRSLQITEAKSSSSKRSPVRK